MTDDVEPLDGVLAARMSEAAVTIDAPGDLMDRVVERRRVLRRRRTAIRASAAVAVIVLIGGAIWSIGSEVSRDTWAADVGSPSSTTATEPAEPKAVADVVACLSGEGLRVALDDESIVLTGSPPSLERFESVYVMCAGPATGDVETAGVDRQRAEARVVYGQAVVEWERQQDRALSEQVAREAVERAESNQEMSNLDKPVLLTAGVDGPAVSTSDVRRQPSYGEPRGTVGSPDGTLFGLGLARRTGEEIPGDRVEVAGLTVTIVQDASAPTQIYRVVDLDCTSLTVTTAGAPAITPEFTTLLESIRSDGAAVDLFLSDEWETYGAAVDVDHYSSRVRLDSGPASGAEVELQQAPAAPIGYWLGGGETAPVLLSDDGTDQLWWVAGATTPGFNRVIGTRYGTLFQLSGRVPVESLQEIADTLVPVRSSLAVEPNNLAPLSEDMAIESDQPAGPEGDCSTDSLSLAIRP